MRDLWYYKGSFYQLGDKKRVAPGDVFLFRNFPAQAGSEDIGQIRQTLLPAVECRRGDKHWVEFTEHGKQVSVGIEEARQVALGSANEEDKIKRAFWQMFYFSRDYLNDNPGGSWPIYKKINELTASLKTNVGIPYNELFDIIEEVKQECEHCPATDWRLSLIDRIENR